MDTGFTGVAIGAKLMTLILEKVQNHLKGYEALSGGIFWEGCWVPASKVNLTLSAANVKAKIPILAVTERGTCHSFKDGECMSKTNITALPTDVKYLGWYFPCLPVLISRLGAQMVVKSWKCVTGLSALLISEYPDLCQSPHR